MGKNRWVSLLLVLVMLITAVPVRALETAVPGVETYSEDAFGGLAPPPEKNSDGKATRPAGEDDYGGLAPENTPSKRKQDSTSAQAAVAGKIPAGVSLITAAHPAYLLGGSGAFPAFHPTRQITRAEAAQMLYRLLPSSTAVPDAAYADVPQGAFYADAVKTLAGLGVLEAQDGMLNTGEPVTRGEFTRYVASFFPLRSDAELFSDVAEDDPNADFIRSARAYGWAQGSGGLYHPDEIITRATAVVLLNRALGRTPDRA